MHKLSNSNITNIKMIWNKPISGLNVIVSLCARPLGDYEVDT